MGRDVVAVWQHPGDSTALWGAESLSQGPPSLDLELARPSGQEHLPPPSTLTSSSEGVINHLARDSRSERRSHLGWSRGFFTRRNVLTNECFILPVSPFILTHVH